MSYKVQRLEHSVNRNGENETFISFIVNDDDIGAFSYATWLTKQEHDLYVSDNTKLDEIIQSYIPMAKSLKIAELNSPKTLPESPPTV